jgi:hypothetical protein
MITKKELYWLLGVFLIWRISLWWLGSIADWFFKYDPSFPYADSLLTQYQLPQSVYSWANFDGVHYITIAEKGYIGTGLIQAFFPVYPFMLRFINYVISNTLVSGLILSNIFTLLLIVSWYGLVKTKATVKIARLAVLLLMCFPTSFFLGALYTESLFLLLVVATWWTLDQRRWGWSAVLIAVAAATKVVGLGLVIPYIWTWWQTYQPSKKFPTLGWQPIKSFLPLFITPLFLIAYMLFLQGEFHDPFYFLHVQSEFGAGRQESLILYPQVVWRAVKIAITYRPIDWKYFAYLQELLAGVGGLIGLILAYHKKWLGWWLFSLIAFLLPTTTGTFSSMPRYILVILPFFWWLAEFFSKRPFFLKIWLIISLTLLVLNTLLFIQGYWVA